MRIATYFTEAHLAKFMDTCQCGRDNKPRPHCPACGSGNIYGRSNGDVVLVVANSEIATELGRDEILSFGYRCRRCRTDFHRYQECEAPRFDSRSMTDRRNEAEAQEKLASLMARHKGDRMAALTELVGRIRPKTKEPEDVPKPSQNPNE